MTPEQKEHEAYLRKLAKRAEASDKIRGPKLTFNPAKANVIVLPREGRKITSNEKDFGAWQRKFS
ncbi:hypothetical protein [Celeribacter baekdonensis]|uniref:hypothetical protein n=1 Tax=Celeribacter baekdonensis TaxID=875171 RepID=UPI003A8DD157